MIFTIGYEGIDLSRFLFLLEQSGVETVVDIREMPLSRKPGFSKTALRAALNLAGYEYVHIGALGCPKDVRNQYREDGNWSAYKRGFLRYLATQEAPIAELSAMASTSSCALLCFEADHNYCHRSMVADAVAAVSGARVKHIAVTQPIKTMNAAAWAWA
ncbi:DUF488 family protein [Bordetella avium]|uniref:DUF488 domain-containing protein n=1 Tax=Bordetella avium TaxID=521 RepID=UPI001F4E9C7F|nr:DUF488 domain-containing protein [Bordetella avium]